MEITKLGHCCLLIEEQNLNILTDPGMFSSKQNDLAGINIILITHEHQDHFHLESVKSILKNNPNARIITNSAVGKLLQEQKIPYEIVEHYQSLEVDGVTIEGFGEEHAPIYAGVTPVQNTGYFIANKFFYPGDAFIDPKKPVEILALPVAGPWMKISEAIDYAKLIHPTSLFPVHDGFLKFPNFFYAIPQKFTESEGIKFIVPEEDKGMEF